MTHKKISNTKVCSKMCCYKDKNGCECHFMT